MTIGIYDKTHVPDQKHQEASKVLCVCWLSSAPCKTLQPATTCKNMRLRKNNYQLPQRHGKRQRSSPALWSDHRSQAHRRCGQEQSSACWGVQIAGKLCCRKLIEALERQTCVIYTKDAKVMDKAWRSAYVTCCRRSHRVGSWGTASFLRKWPQDERVEQNIACWGPSFLFNTSQSLAVFLVCWTGMSETRPFWWGNWIENNAADCLERLSEKPFLPAVRRNGINNRGLLKKIYFRTWSRASLRFRTAQRADCKLKCLESAKTCVTGWQQKREQVKCRLIETCQKK